jgi:hypothetical protein
LTLGIAQAVAQTAIQVRHGNQCSRKCVDGRQLQIFAEFFPQRHAAAPITGSSAVVGKSLRKEIPEKFLRRQAAAPSEKRDVAVVIVERGNLEKCACSHLSFDCQLFMVTALQYGTPRAHQERRERVQLIQSVGQDAGRVHAFKFRVESVVGSDAVG